MIKPRFYIFLFTGVIAGVLILFGVQIRSFAKRINSQNVKTVQYAIRPNTDANLTSLDIYSLSNAKKAPVMIMIHGGGWRNGDKKNPGLNVNKVPFFHQNGFIYLSINYRLSPAVQHPGHIEDVAEAVSWVFDNIEKYGGDKNRIFVMGHSAGAHLAALVATDERRLKKHGKDLSIIKGVILLDGAGYDIPTQMKETGFIGIILKSMYLNAFSADEQVQRDASPYFHVNRGKNIPPFLIFTAGSRRDSVSQSKTLVESLNKEGIQAEVIDDKDKNHGTINRNFGLQDEMITAKAKEFLNGIVKK